MTARREVPLPTDTLAWVHNELAEVKSKVTLALQAAQESRNVATNASELAHQARGKVDQVDAYAPAIQHVQDDLRALRELVVRSQDDIHALRQTRDEIERRLLTDSERSRQDRNEVAHRFSDLERHVEAWLDRFTSTEEHNRRNLEAIAQLVQRLEALEAQQGDIDTLQSRTLTTIGRIDQDLLRLTALIPPLEREDEVHRERTSSALEALRRLELEVEAIKRETNRIARIDDRVELVQAERTRHNERLNEITAELNHMQGRISEHHDRAALIEVKISSYQEELRGLKDRMHSDREQITAHLHAVKALDADMRKRQITAIEKEIRDIRGRVLQFKDD